MQDSAYGSSHGRFLQKPGVVEEASPPFARTKSCKFSVDFGPRDLVDEINYNPSQLYDVLPQPFRFLNRLLTSIVEGAIETAERQAALKAAGEGTLDLPSVEPGATLALGQLSAMTAMPGTQYRVALDQAGSLVVFDASLRVAAEVARVEGAAAGEDGAALCCKTTPLDGRTVGVVVMHTSDRATVYTLRVPAGGDDGAENPTLAACATVAFAQPARSVCMGSDGMLASSHDGKVVCLYRLPPSAVDTDAALDDVPEEPVEPSALEALHTLYDAGGDAALQDDEGTAVPVEGAVVDFLCAPVPHVGEDCVVGFLLRWHGEARLQRYNLDPRTPDAPAPKLANTWVCGSVITASSMDACTTMYLTGHADGGVAVWDQRLATLHCCLPGHRRAIKALEWGCDPLVVSLCEDGRAHVCDADSGTCLGMLDGLRSIHVLPNLHSMVAVMQNGAARVVDLHTAEFVGTLEVGAAPAALGGVLSVQGLQCAALPVVDGGGTVVCRASMNGASVSTEGTPGTAEPSWEQALRLAVTRESVTQGGAGAMLDLELVETEGGEVLARGVADLGALLWGGTPAEGAAAGSELEDGSLSVEIALEPSERPKGDGEPGGAPEAQPPCTLGLRLRFAPANDCAHPSVDMGDCVVSLRVAADVAAADVLVPAEGRAVCSPQSAALFDAQHVSRRLRARSAGQTADAAGAQLGDVSAVLGRDSLGQAAQVTSGTAVPLWTQGTAPPSLPPAQYPSLDTMDDTVAGEDQDVDLIEVARTLGQRNCYSRPPGEGGLSLYGGGKSPAAKRTGQWDTLFAALEQAAVQ